MGCTTSTAHDPTTLCVEKQSPGCKPSSNLTPQSCVLASDGAVVDDNDDSDEDTVVTGTIAIKPPHRPTFEDEIAHSVIVVHDDLTDTLSPLSESSTPAELLGCIDALCGRFDVRVRECLTEHRLDILQHVVHAFDTRIVQETTQWSTRDDGGMRGLAMLIRCVENYSNVRHTALGGMTIGNLENSMSTLGELSIKWIERFMAKYEKVLRTTTKNILMQTDVTNVTDWFAVASHSLTIAISSASDELIVQCTSLAIAMLAQFASELVMRHIEQPITKLGPSSQSKTQSKTQSNTQSLRHTLDQFVTCLGQHLTKMVADATDGISPSNALCINDDVLRVYQQILQGTYQLHRCLALAIITTATTTTTPIEFNAVLTRELAVKSCPNSVAILVAKGIIVWYLGVVLKSSTVAFDTISTCLKPYIVNRDMFAAIMYPAKMVSELLVCTTGRFIDVAIEAIADCPESATFIAKIYSRVAKKRGDIPRAGTALVTSAVAHATTTYCVDLMDESMLDVILVSGTESTNEILKNIKVVLYQTLAD